MLTKKGDRMAYLTLEDLHGTVEVIVFPDLFKTAGDLIVPERLVRITGTIDRGDKGTKMRGSKIEPLAEVQTQIDQARPDPTVGSIRRPRTTPATPRHFHASPRQHDGLTDVLDG